MKRKTLISVIIILILGLGLSAYMLSKNKSSSAETSFYKTVKNSLVSGNVTTVVTSKLESGNSTTISHISFDDQPQLSQSQTVYNNQGNIVAETNRIATLDKSYTRVTRALSVDGSKSLDMPQNIKDVWGEKDERPIPSVIPTEIYAPMPLGKLTNEQADTVVQYMKKAKAYTIDDSTVKRGPNDQIEFELESKAKELAESLQKYDSISKYVNKPEQAHIDELKKRPNSKYKVTVNTKTNQIVRFKFFDSDYTIEYKPYQLTKPDPLPTANIPFEQLRDQVKQFIK